MIYPNSFDVLYLRKYIDGVEVTFHSRSVSSSQAAADKDVRVPFLDYALNHDRHIRSAGKLEHHGDELLSLHRSLLRALARVSWSRVTAAF